MNPKIEGVSEKLSAVYVADKLVLEVGNETAVLSNDSHSCSYTECDG